MKYVPGWKHSCYGFHSAVTSIDYLKCVVIGIWLKPFSETIPEMDKEGDLFSNYMEKLVLWKEVGSVQGFIGLRYTISGNLGCKFC